MSRSIQHAAKRTEITGTRLTRTHVCFVRLARAYCEHHEGSNERELVKCGSLDEARRAALWYIDQYNLGTSVWRGGEVVEAEEGGAGRLIARISYNGRVWLR